MHFQFRKKGVLVLPITIFSVIIVFIGYGVVSRALHLNEVKHIQNLLGGISMLLAGVINFFVSKNYIVNSEGEKELYEEEGTFMFIKVTLWTRIFFALGALITITAVLDIYKL